MDKGIFRALCTLEPNRMQEAERSAVFFSMKNKPGLDGTTKVTIDDIRYNKLVLKEVLLELMGFVPTVRVFEKAMHNMDIASDGVFSKTEKGSETLSPNHPTPWAIFEGKILHDLVAYIHHLRVSSKSCKAKDPDVQMLKEACGSPKTRRRRTVKADDTSTVDTPVGDDDLTEVPNYAMVKEVADHVREFYPVMAEADIQAYASSLVMGLEVPPVLCGVYMLSQDIEIDSDDDGDASDGEDATSGTGDGVDGGGPEAGKTSGTGGANGSSAGRKPGALPAPQKPPTVAQLLASCASNHTLTSVGLVMPAACLRIRLPRWRRRHSPSELAMQSTRSGKRGTSTSWPSFHRKPIRRPWTMASSPTH